MMEAYTTSNVVTCESDDDGSCNDVLAQLKHDNNNNDGNHQSSEQSTAPLSDSMTGSEFEYGANSNDDSKTEMMTLNESLNNFDTMLKARRDSLLQGRPPASHQSRMNSSFGSLGKTVSARNFDVTTDSSCCDGTMMIMMMQPPARHARRRSSVHGYTPSDTYEMSPSFQTEFKASVDDWNSELPLDDDDEINASYSSHLNASSKSVLNASSSNSKSFSSLLSPQKASFRDKVKNVSLPTEDGTTTMMMMKSPTTTTTSKTTRNKVRKSKSSTDTGSSSSKSKDRTSSSKLKKDCVADNNNKMNSSGLGNKLESRFFVQSVRMLRNGISFRSTGSAKSTNTFSTLSKSEHFYTKNNVGNENCNSVLVEGTSMEF